MLEPTQGPSRTHDEQTGVWAAAMNWAAASCGAMVGLRILALGPLPKSVLGVTSLRNRVELVQPRHDRARTVSAASPGVTILRMDLPTALPRLGEYDVVLSADPTYVRGPWSWAEAFDVIQRLAGTTSFGAIALRFPTHPLGTAPAAEPFADPTRLRSIVQASRSIHAQLRGYALEFHPFRQEEVIGFDPAAPLAEAMAAAVIAEGYGTGELPLTTYAELAARFAVAPLAAHAPAGLVVPSNVPEAAFVSSASAHVKLAAQPLPASGASMQPLTVALADALLHGHVALARQLAQLYLTARPPEDSRTPLSRCLVTRDAKSLVFMENQQRAADPRRELTAFIEGFCTSPQQTLRLDPATVIRTLLGDRHEDTA